MPTQALTKVERMARRLRGRTAAGVKLLEDARRGLPAREAQGQVAAHAAHFLVIFGEVDDVLAQVLAACGRVRAEARQARRLLRKARADAVAARGTDAWRGAVGRWQVAEQFEARILGRADAHLAPKVQDEVLGPMAVQLELMAADAEKLALICRAVA